MLYPWLALTLVAGCGRIGFDADNASAVGDATGGARDARADAFEAPSCTPSCNGGEFCGTAIGACGAAGSCQLVQTGCVLHDYVCGCDGFTYENACEAAAVGISVAALGPCPMTSSYVPNCTPLCTGATYCYTETGMCGQPGTCVPIPAPDTLPGCMDMLVCGCDGLVYGSGCAATYAGMSTAGLAPCAM